MYTGTSLVCAEKLMDILLPEQFDIINMQWCIAKNGGGYTQRGVAKGLKAEGT